MHPETLQCVLTHNREIFLRTHSSVLRFSKLNAGAALRPPPPSVSQSRPRPGATFTTSVPSGAGSHHGLPNCISSSRVFRPLSPGTSPRPLPLMTWTFLRNTVSPPRFETERPSCASQGSLTTGFRGCVRARTLQGLTPGAPRAHPALASDANCTHSVRVLFSFSTPSLLLFF